MKVALIRWRDAMYVEGDNLPAKAQLADLNCVGFLLDETPEAVLIAMESHGGRWRLNIPRGQIVEMKLVDEGKVFVKPRKPRRVVPTVVPEVVVGET